MPIGFWEIVVILVAALVLFGPNRLPEMGKALGQAIREFRKYTSELGSEFEKARRDLEEGAAAEGGGPTGDKHPGTQSTGEAAKKPQQTPGEKTEPAGAGPTTDRERP